jgi:hypothetical protein
MIRFQSELFYLDGSGTIVIDATRYSDARSFSSGLAVVRDVAGKYGFINKEGLEEIEPRFDEVRNFSDDLAWVVFRNSYQSLTRGFVDKTGDFILEPDFDVSHDFSEGIAVCELHNDVFLLSKNGNVAFLCQKGKLDLDYFGEPKFSEGLIAARNVETGKIGFINTSGDFVIDPIYKNAASFSEGLARVSVIKDNRELLGFINHNGEFVIDPIFDIDSDFKRSTTDFSEDMASLIDGTSWDLDYFYIDNKGAIVLRTKYKIPGQFKNGLAAVYDEELNTYGFIDKSGNLVIPAKYGMANSFSEGLAIVEGV